METDVYLDSHKTGLNIVAMLIPFVWLTAALVIVCVLPTNLCFYLKISITCFKMYHIIGLLSL